MSRKTIFTVLMTPYLLMGYAIIAAHGDYDGRRGSDYQAGLAVVSTLNLSPTSCQIRWATVSAM